MQYKMLHSAIKYSPEPPNFQEFVGSIERLNPADYACNTYCDPVVDISADAIRKVFVNCLEVLHPLNRSIVM